MHAVVTGQHSEASPIESHHSPQDEAQLLLCAKQGCGECTNRLFEDNLQRLTNFVSRMATGGLCADEILQQTLLRAFANLRQFRGECRFSSWLAGIALNEVRQAARRRGRATFLSLQQEGQEMQIRDRVGISPHDQFRKQQTAQMLRDAITELSPSYQAVIRLRDLEELSLPDTAKRLSLTISAAKTRHSRARKRLMEMAETPGGVLAALGAHG